MKQYLDLLKHIKDNGVDDGERTGTGARSVFGHQMRFNLQKGFPLLTTKKLHLKSIIHELLWFLKGETNIKYLKDNNVSIWDEWADERGELGPVYGKQWRSWDNLVPTKEITVPYGEFGDYTQEMLYDKKPIDQISWAINRLKTNPQCRRIIVSAWNVADIPKMKLAPCHCLFQFYTAPMSLNERFENLISRYEHEDAIDVPYSREAIMNGDPEFTNKCLDEHAIPRRKLSCQLYQRSCDTFLGVPYNIASYSLLTMMFAQCVNMVPWEFVWTGGNVHLYHNHMQQVDEQLSRTPYNLPTMKINPEVKDIFGFKYEDFTLENYQSHPSIKAPIAV